MKKIVIEISDERYKEIVESNKPVMIYRSDVAKVLVTGTPLNEVLNKISAEIEQNAYPIVHGVNNHEKGMTLYGILQVIDKYKEGSDK